jgi:hypothetical protein
LATARDALYQAGETMGVSTLSAIGAADWSAFESHVPHLLIRANEQVEWTLYAECARCGKPTTRGRLVENPPEGPICPEHFPKAVTTP